MKPNVVIEYRQPYTIAQYQEVEAKIAGADKISNEGRWECGKMLLQERNGQKRLPNRRLDELALELKCSRQELGFRQQFATRYPTKSKLSNVLDSSWHDIIQSFSVNGDAHELISQSLSNEWYTPGKYIEAAREVLGTIDLDPASCAQANTVVRAKKFYSAKDDGLAQEWEGNVWMNPPWGDLTGKFVDKLVESVASRQVESAIVLVNAHATDTEWFRPLWDCVLCFTDHRIDYLAPEGKEKTTTSTHGSVFAYFGNNWKEFTKVFAQFGPIVERVG